MGSKDNTTLSWFWYIAFTIKLLTVGAGMAVLVINPSYYIVDTWQIHVEDIQLRRIYALVYQFAITSTATFVLFLALLVYTKPFPGMEKERMRLMTYFFICGCFIDIASLICTCFVYKVNHLQMSWSVKLSIVIDIFWLFMEALFSYTHWQGSPKSLSKQAAAVASPSNDKKKTKKAE